MRLVAEYEPRLRGYAEGGVTGVRDWLVHCAAALAEAAGWARALKAEEPETAPAQTGAAPVTDVGATMRATDVCWPRQA